MAHELALGAGDCGCLCGSIRPIALDIQISADLTGEADPQSRAEVSGETKHSSELPWTYSRLSIVAGFKNPTVDLTEILYELKAGESSQTTLPRLYESCYKTVGGELLIVNNAIGNGNKRLYFRAKNSCDYGEVLTFQYPSGLGMTASIGTYTRSLQGIINSRNQWTVGYGDQWRDATDAESLLMFRSGRMNFASPDLTSANILGLLNQISTTSQNAPAATSLDGTVEYHNGYVYQRRTANKLAVYAGRRDPDNPDLPVVTPTGPFAFVQFGIEIDENNNRNLYRYADESRQSKTLVLGPYKYLRFGKEPGCYIPGDPENGHIVAYFNDDDNIYTGTIAETFNGGDSWSYKPIEYPRSCGVANESRVTTLAGKTSTQPAIDYSALTPEEREFLESGQ